MDISAITGSLGNSYSKINTEMQMNQAKTDSFQTALNTAIEAQNKDDIKRSCVEFESYFIHMMFKEMRKTLHPENGILPPSRAEEYFQDMLDEESSKAIAEGNGIGLADMMYKQLTMLSEND